MTIRRSPTAAAVLTVLALTAACGDDEAPATPGAGGATTTSTTTTTTTDTEACAVDAGVDPPVEPPPVHTPRWAFEPWISKDISDAADTYAFVKGFKDRDIPVGVVVIDSPWETHYNTFVPNPSRYPGFEKMVSDLHAQDVRIVLWVTQMVNQSYLDGEAGGDYVEGPSPNLADALACGFLVDDGAMWSWWKGRGGGVDFFNPAAVTWWHRQQDALYAMGINGWKLDFGESYIREDTVQTAKGPVPHQEYSEAYYRDYYAYGASKRTTEEFVTMVRPWDESYDFEGRFFARKEHAPVAWVGDNRRDWVGLVDALDEMFRSAAAGYVVLGSDVGGYLDFDDKDPFGPKVPFDLEVFQRWVALGALSPFMQLHGRANLVPWDVPDCDTACDEGVAAHYRFWATLHHELVPFLYSLAEDAHAAGTAMMHPQGGEAEWPGDYRYLLGDALLVAPVIDASGQRDVAFPAGSRWLDFWDLAAAPHEGGTKLVGLDVSDRARIPLYVREGAIVPMSVSNDVTGMGTAASAGQLTLFVVPPAAGSSSFTLHDEDGATTAIEAAATPTGSTLTLSRAIHPVTVRARLDAAPAGVAVDGAPLAMVGSREALDAAGAGAFWDAATSSLWARFGAGAGARELAITAP